MSTSGCLFDFDKLNDVSKNVISKMTAEEVYSELIAWARDFDEDFYEKLTRNEEFAKSILAIGRGGKKPRKDLTTWTDVKPYMALFYDEYFEFIDAIPENFNKEDVKSALVKFMESYDPTVDNNAWFENVKSIAEQIGYAPDVKLYKANPEAYKGHVGDVSMFIRVAVTGKQNSPDLYTIMQIIGQDKVNERIKAYIEALA